MTGPGTPVPDLPSAHRAWSTAVDRAAAGAAEDVDVLVALVPLRQAAAGNPEGLLALLATELFLLPAGADAETVHRRAEAVDLLESLVPGDDLSCLQHLHRTIAELVSVVDDRTGQHHHPRAAAALETAQLLVDRVGPELAAATDAVTGWALAVTGDREEAMGCFEDAWDEAPTSVAAHSWSAMAAEFSAAGPPAVTARWYRRAAIAAADDGRDVEALACRHAAVRVSAQPAEDALVAGRYSEAAEALSELLVDLSVLRAGTAGEHRRSIDTLAGIAALQLMTARASLSDWDRAAAAVDEALRSLTAAADPQRIAAVHLAWGATLVGSGARLAEARRHLERARSLLVDQPVLLAVCVSLVEQLDLLDHLIDGSAAAPAAVPDIAEGPQAAFLRRSQLVTQALRAILSGHLAGLADLVAPLRAAEQELGADSGTMAGALLPVVLALRAGQPADAAAALAGARGTVTSPTGRAVVESLTAVVTLAQGNAAAALPQLWQARAALLAVGADQLAARIAVAIAQQYLAHGDPAAAARVGVPAVLALDAHRFTLASAERRRAWGATVAAAATVAYRAAAAADDGALLAELLETLRASGVPVVLEGGADPLPLELDLLAAGSPPRPRPVDLPGGSTSRGAWFLVAPEETTVLGLPLPVELPWGGSCRAALEAAATYGRPPSPRSVRLVIPR